MCHDAPLVAYLHRVLGYTLTGSTKEQCLFLLTGNGCNGKTTLLELVKFIMGEYGEPVAAKTLMQQGREDVPSDIASLEGKRFATCSETSSIQKFNESRLKLMTGGEAIQARRRYSDEFNFYPQFKLFIATNDKPTIRDNSEGTWRRFHTIPFDMQLEPENINKNLLKELKEEAAGVLNWMIDGALEWHRIGLKVNGRS